MASRAETSVDHSFGYLDKETVIKWNSKNPLTCEVLADPVTYIVLDIMSLQNLYSELAMS